MAFFNHPWENCQLISGFLFYLFLTIFSFFPACTGLYREYFFMSGSEGVDGKGRARENVNFRSFMDPALLKRGVLTEPGGQGGARI